MRWQHLCSTYEQALRDGSKDEPCTPMFIRNTTLGDGRWSDLKHRVVEHVCEYSILTKWPLVDSAVYHLLFRCLNAK